LWQFCWGAISIDILRIIPAAFWERLLLAMTSVFGRAHHVILQAGPVYPDRPAYARYFDPGILAAADPPECGPAKSHEALGLLVSNPGGLNFGIHWNSFSSPFVVLT
jgi:hypothetical protein